MPGDTTPRTSLGASVIPFGSTAPICAHSTLPPGAGTLLAPHTTWGAAACPPPRRRPRRGCPRRDPSSPRSRGRRGSARARPPRRWGRDRDRTARGASSTGSSWLELLQEADVAFVIELDVIDPVA